MFLTPSSSISEGDNIRSKQWPEMVHTRRPFTGSDTTSLHVSSQTAQPHTRESISDSRLRSNTQEFYCIYPTSKLQWSKPFLTMDMSSFLTNIYISYLIVSACLPRAHMINHHFITQTFAFLPNRNLISNCLIKNYSVIIYLYIIAIKG